MKIKTLAKLGLAAAIAGTLWVGITAKPKELNPECDSAYRLISAYGEPKTQFVEVTGDSLPDRILAFKGGKVYFIDRNEEHFRDFAVCNARKMNAGTPEATRYSQSKGQHYWLDNAEGW